MARFYVFTVMQAKYQQLQNHTLRTEAAIVMGRLNAFTVHISLGSVVVKHIHVNCSASIAF